MRQFFGQAQLPDGNGKLPGNFSRNLLMFGSEVTGRIRIYDKQTNWTPLKREQCNKGSPHSFLFHALKVWVGLWKQLEIVDYGNRIGAERFKTTGWHGIAVAF